ncbi:hypothetical protein GYH30_042636 [Glycine max]|nr:hypothetical protein GYH30_042636 [Glycine max]
MHRSAVELEAELGRLLFLPSLKDALEKEKAILEDGMKNFHRKIEDEELLSWIEQSERVLVEKDKGSTEAELLRNALEEQACDLHTILSHKIKDLEALAMECNQALKRLKIGNGIQYLLNAKETTRAEIMGIDHKLSICNAGHFNEDEARFFFRQLISGVSYCHAMVTDLHKVVL